MAIRDIVRHGFSATIGTVVTRGWGIGQPPTATVYRVTGSLPTYSVTGSSND